MIYYVVFFLLLLAILCISRYELTHFKIKRYQLKNKKVKGHIRILYLSDLHESCFGKDNGMLLEAVRKARPDLILLGGDMIVGKGKRVDTKNAYHFLKNLQVSCPVIYTYGNHETRVRETKKFREYEEKIKELPVILLNNECVTQIIRENKIQIYGLELENDCYNRDKDFKLSEKECFPEGSASIRILLAHSPNFFDEYVKIRPDYVFCGHNHGGIVRIPGLGGLISTEYRLFPRYSYGRYHRENTDMILSAGAGTHTIKFRLFNPSEIVIADIEE